VARQDLLVARAAITVVLGLTTSLVAGGARAQSDEPDDVLHRPERLTVAEGDQLLGQLAPDGQTLYFVSNRNKATQIFAQSIADGRAKLLFDDVADVTWPRISPDGKRLLYVSFGDRALGQLCVRDLPGGTDRRCLADPSAVVQAEWVDRSRIVVVSRRSLQGDLRVLEVVAGSTLSARPLLDRNITGPAVSPDGQWLAYVPVERDVPTVGPAFASHGGQRLEAVRLASPGATATPLTIDLPGLTGQPAFARDGRSIYIVQFINDSNHDGVIDASDDGALFRVPLSTDAGTPVAGPPEQLTETSYNCEYPAPATDRLIATCARGNSLDVYALPLDGEVPPDWTTDRLATELAAASTRFERQLLASRLLLGETTPTARRLALLSVVMAHLDLEQYEAAALYSDRVSELRDRATAGLGSTLRALVDQRRAVRDRERGLLVDRFAEQARARLGGLRLPAQPGPVAVAFDHVVRSEIADSIGDETQARAELEAASLDATAPAPIVEAYYQRADALYRELDDREALVDVCRRLSGSDALAADERLRYAQAAAWAMLRGLPLDDATARLTRERADLPDDSELAFALDVSRAVLALRDARPLQPVADGLLALYARQTRPERRRALVEQAVARARQVGAGDVVQALAQRFVDDTRRGTRERRAAERLYRVVMTERAFRRTAGRRVDDARADFDAIVQQTGSYEAVMGSIDVRLGGGESPASIEASYAHTEVPPAQSGFARAYLLARGLPKLEGRQASEAEAAALALVHASWADLHDKRVAQALDGALLHDEYIRTGDLAAAEKANLHYGIALELIGGSPRFRAMILGQLGILHTQVGNYRIALDYLQDRDRLPYRDGPEGLAVHLALARALLHVGRDADAATAADAAMAMVDRAPSLAAFRALSLDRDALCNLAAGRFARALSLYDTQMPLLDAATGASADRNRFVARVARASAAVGAGQPQRALVDLAEVERELDDPRRVAELKWGRVSADTAVRAYRLIATGLRARASRELGRLDDEARALGVRHAALQERFATTQRTEDERDAMLAEAQLALSAADRRDPASAASWLKQALAHADDLRARAKGQVDREQLDVLWLAAQLTVETKAPLVPDLPQRLETASGTIAARRDRVFRSYERRFETYLPIVGPAPVASTKGPDR
jgi:hypothetical protein